MLHLDPQQVVDALPAVQACYDEPFADMASVPTWYASKLAAEHVKVVLCGEGGDELFAGYKRHRNARNIERYRSGLTAIEPLLSMLTRTPTGNSSRLNYVRQHLERAVEFLRLKDGYQQFFAATQISSQAVRRRIYSSSFSHCYEAPNSYERLEAEYFGTSSCNRDALESFLHADLTVNMPSAMLTRLDRASMAHSLEARVPFLSHKLVDWAGTIPPGLKLRGNTGKYLLRRAIAPWLPPSLMQRPKQGFQMPLADWFRGSLGDYARDAWNGSAASQAGYLDLNSARVDVRGTPSR